ncbi:MAG: PAS domain S-box protein [Gallionella sp.]|nr:PAS domain S-box protein [Gallionella sp.]
MKRVSGQVLKMTTRDFLLRLLAGVTVFNLFTIGLASWTIQQQYALHHEQAETGTQNLVLALQSELQGQIRANEMALFAVQDELYRQRAGGRVNATALNAYIEQVRARAQGIDAIRITDAHGTLLYGTDVKLAARISLADRPHFIRLRDHADAGLVISKPQISRANNKAVIVLALRLARGDGSFNGMVFAAIPLTHLTGIFSGLDIGEHGMVAMRDDELAMVARFPESPLRDLVAGSKNVSPELERKVRAGQTSGTYRTDASADHIERTLSFRKVGNRPIYLIVGFAGADYLAAARMEAKKITALVAIFALVTLILSGMAYRSWLQQRRLNQSLLESETRLNELFENMSSGVAVYRASDDGQDFFFTGFNRAAERFDKVRREDLLGKNVAEVFPGIDELGLLDVFRRVWQTGVTERYPLSFYHDGRISGWRDNFVYKLPGGEIVAIYDDVTERKKAEQALRQSESLFRAITDTSPLAIYMSSGLEQRAEYINPTFIRLFGYTIDEVPTVAHWWPRAYPDEAYRRQVAEEWQRRVSQAIETHSQIEPVEVVVTCKDGSRKNISWGFISIGEQNWAFGLDLTERKQAEQAVQISMKRLNEAQRIGKIGNWELDLMSGRLHWSDEIFRLFGIDPDQFAASYEAFLQAIHPDDREKVNHAYTDSLETRQPYEITHRLLMADGSIKWVHERCETIFDGQGKALRSIGTIQDVTERKLAEEALRRSNADLERFAYSVSHDMRQPLRAVSGHLQLLQRSLKDKLDDEERENMDFALDGARRMDSMIVSLLDYSRVGRKTESKKWLASQAPLDEALGFLAPLIADTQAEVRLGGEWPQVFASRDELTRLFQNLIGNAIKFCETGHPALVEINSSVHDDTWRVSVRDHGIGINPQQIDRLFQFFSRLQSRARFEGTGMGLALCRRIVEHHDGRIWVESEGEGKGSTFVFEMPLGQGTGKD